MEAPEWLGALSTGQAAILVAVGVGMLSLIVVFCLSTRGSSSKRKETKPEVEELSSEQSIRKTRKDSSSDPQKKQWKAKTSAKPRRTTLPSHPLLAADFKGHTGAVLSLDFDSTGRYLVSCSEGTWLLATF